MSQIDQIITTVQIFFSQEPDVIVTKLLLYFGWIPIFAVIVRGLLEVWQNWREDLWEAKQRFVLLAIDVPRESVQSPKAVENIFAAISAARSSPNFKEKWFEGKSQRPFSFEIASIDGYIQFYIRTHIRNRDMIESAIYAQYPDAEITEAEDYTQNVPDNFPDDDWDMHGTEYRLDKPNYFPIRTWINFEHSLSQELKDPLAVLLEGLSKLKPGEQIWLQFVMIPATNAWKKEGDDFIKDIFGVKDAPKKSGAEKIGGWVFDAANALVTDVTGVGVDESSGKDEGMQDLWKAFKVTEQEREISKQVVQKISKIGFETKCRYIYIGKKEVFKKGFRNDMIKGVFKLYSHLDLNSFGKAGTVTPKDDYFWQRWFYWSRVNKLILAYKNRSLAKGAPRYVLNTEELATLYHFPTIEIKAPLISKTVSKRAEPPSKLKFASEEEEYASAPATPSTGNEITFEIEGGSGESEMELPRSLPVESAENEEKEPDMDLDKPHISGITPPTQESRKAVEPERIKESDQPAAASLPNGDEIPDAVKLLIDPDTELEDVKDKLN